MKLRTGAKESMRVDTKAPEKSFKKDFEIMGRMIKFAPLRKKEIRENGLLETVDKNKSRKR